LVAGARGGTHPALDTADGDAQRRRGGSERCPPARGERRRVVAALITLAIGLVLGVAVGIFFTRRSAAPRLPTILHRLDPDPLVASGMSLTATLDCLEKAVAREQAIGVTARAAIERLRLALDALPAGVVVADARGNVVLRNRSATHFLGIRHADVLVD